MAVASSIGVAMRPAVTRLDDVNSILGTGGVFPFSDLHFSPGGMQRGSRRVAGRDPAECASPCFAAAGALRRRSADGRGGVLGAAGNGGIFPLDGRARVAERRGSVAVDRG